MLLMGFVTVVYTRLQRTTMEADFIWFGFFRKPVLERFISKTIFNLYDIHKHISPLKLFKLNLDILQKESILQIMSLPRYVIYNKI